jgi:hypothetical protein
MKNLHIPELIAALLVLMIPRASACDNCAAKDDKAAPQAVILKNPEVITKESLCGVRLLELTIARPYTPAERECVEAFLRGGGSLFAVIDEESRTPLLADGVQSILAPFGLAYTADTPYLHNCGALARKGAVVHADYELPYSGGRSVTGGEPFVWRLDEKGAPAEIAAAYLEIPGGGRIVAMAEGMTYLGMGTAEGVRLTGINNDPALTTYWGKDAQAFLKDVRCWLQHCGCCSCK